MNFLLETYRAAGMRGCARKLAAAAKMSLIPLLLGRRSNASVAAYFDLITDDGRMFYGDSFHFGYFHQGDESFAEALDAHTDLVADMAALRAGDHVLDIGCGIGAPAIRIAMRLGCSLTGINISPEQIKQGRELVTSSGMAGQVTLQEGNALHLDFADASFDAILCLEVAGDICVTPAQKVALVEEIYRVAKPGARIGFSDLIFTSRPTGADNKVMQMILYHSGDELVTDWPALFRQRGFVINEQRDILAQTMPTWAHSVAVYQNNSEAVNRRYGRTLSNRTQAYLRRIPEILGRHGAFVVMALQKPSQ